MVALAWRAMVSATSSRTSKLAPCVVRVESRGGTFVLKMCSHSNVVAELPHSSRVGTWRAVGARARKKRLFGVVAHAALSVADRLSMRSSPRRP